jgi:hypothetical protein
MRAAERALLDLRAYALRLDELQPSSHRRSRSLSLHHRRVRTVDIRHEKRAELIQLVEDGRPDRRTTPSR